MDHLLSHLSFRVLLSTSQHLWIYIIHHYAFFPLFDTHCYMHELCTRLLSIYFPRLSMFCYPFFNIPEYVSSVITPLFPFLIFLTLSYLLFIRFLFVSSSIFHTTCFSFYIFTHQCFSCLDTRYLLICNSKHRVWTPEHPIYIYVTNMPIQIYQTPAKCFLYPLTREIEKRHRVRVFDQSWNIVFFLHIKRFL